MAKTDIKRPMTPAELAARLGELTKRIEQKRTSLDRIAEQSATASLAEVKTSVSSLTAADLEKIGRAFEHGMRAGQSEMVEVFKTAVLQTAHADRGNKHLVIMGIIGAGVFTIIGALIGRSW